MHLFLLQMPSTLSLENLICLDKKKADDRLGWMKQLFLAALPFLTGIVLVITPANGQLVSFDPPVPLCGPYIRENVQTQSQGHDDFGTCSSQYPHFKYQRIVTEKIYQRGSKYYCDDWAFTNYCIGTAAPFADCPSHTCSNPEAGPESGGPCCGG